MSEKTNKEAKPVDVENTENTENLENTNDVENTGTKKSDNPKRQVVNLEKRLGQLEKRLANNERFARTFAASLSTQVVAIDAVSAIVRRSLRNDAKVQQELSTAIQIYDRHKVQRWFSGALSVALWIISVVAAAFVGATIHWLFEAQ